MPALAVIDINGRVRLMHYADSPGDIPSNQKILSLLDELVQEESHTG